MSLAVDDALDDGVRRSDPRPVRGAGLFRAFWRWHFYASVIVIPVLLTLAITGLIYLFRHTLDPLISPELTVTAGDVRTTLDQQQAAAEAAVPGGAVLAVREGGDDRASVFTVASGSDETVLVLVDPFTAEVTGTRSPGTLLSDYAVTLHGELMTGSWGDAVIELGACWAIVMALTGYFLFFRGWRARRRSKAKLRSMHGLIGAGVGVGLLLLVVSGLPWTGIWGSQVQELAAPRGLSLWGEDPGAVSRLGERVETVDGRSGPAGWAIGETPVPASDPAGDGVVSVSDAAVAAAAAGVPRPYFVAYPDGDEGVFSVMGDQWNDPSNPAFRDVSLEAVAHVDQYSGDVVATYGYGDYTPVAKVVSRGIALHEGRAFGGLSTVMAAAFCLGVIALCITGPLMWWRRRAAGTGLAAPRGKMPIRATPWLVGALVVLGVLLPLFGISLLVILLLDQLAIRRSRALRRTFNTVDR